MKIKKIISVLLVLTLMISSSISVNAAEGDGVEAIKAQIANTYAQSKSLAGVSSFNGYCAAYVKNQLYVLGINSKNEAHGNGNNYWDYYSGLSTSSGGYNIAKYSASSYSITSALNAITNNGSKNAYNIMVCFNVGYNGESAGHVFFVHAVIGGTVYYSESFRSNSINEGGVQSCAISSLAGRYSSYVFEGIIHFYKSHTHSYTSSVTTQPTCTKTGVRTYKCSCGASYTESIAATGNHSYTSAITKQPKCTEDGVKTYTCSSCGGSYTESIPAIGHSYEKDKIESKDGYILITYKCKNCGNTYEEKSTEEYVWSDWSTEKPVGISEKDIEQKKQYRVSTKETLNSTQANLEGYELVSSDVSYGSWSSNKTTTSKPTESDVLKITGSSTVYNYYHYCCNYYDGCNNVDSISCGSGSHYYHTLTTSSPLSKSSVADKGGKQSYKGSACSKNFLVWFYAGSTTTYTYQTRTKTTTYTYTKWSDFSDWGDEVTNSDSTHKVETRDVYRYKIYSNPDIPQPPFSEILSIKADKASVKKDEYVNVTLSLKGTESIKTIGLDTIMLEDFEIVETKWLVKGSGANAGVEPIISTYQKDSLKGAASFNKETVCAGDIFAIKLKAKKDASINGFGFDVVVKNIQDSEEKILFQESVIVDVPKCDLDGNGTIDSDDAIFLLMNTLFPEDYPIINVEKFDFDKNGSVDSDDAIYLLMNTLFSEDYPI